MRTIEEVIKVIEALLLVSDEPLNQSQLVDLLADADEDHSRLAELVPRALFAIEQQCLNRAYQLVEVKSGFRFQVRADMNPWVKKLFGQRTRQYSRAVLETLALIAYKQPITRGEIEKVRGVAVHTQIIRNLMERGWIRELGTREVPGRPLLYGTTERFLDYFNLSSLSDLPPLKELEDLTSPDSFQSEDIPVVLTPSDTIKRSDSVSDE